MSILIFGHKNPDTDTICSAIAYAELKNKLGKDVKAVRLGDINEETKYALNYFKVKKPELVENVAGKEIILVDHNEKTQTADGFEEAKVLRDAIVKIKKLQTATTLDFANLENIDIIAASKQSNKAVCIMMFVRNGKLVSKTEKSGGPHPSLLRGGDRGGRQFQPHGR